MQYTILDFTCISKTLLYADNIENQLKTNVITVSTNVPKNVKTCYEM